MHYTHHCAETNCTRYTYSHFIYHKNTPIERPGLHGRALNKRLYIQRRLAWSLSKNDTHNRREAKLFLVNLGLKVDGSILHGDAFLDVLLCFPLAVRVMLPFACLFKKYFIFVHVDGHSSHQPLRIDQDKDTVTTLFQTQLSTAINYTTTAITVDRLNIFVWVQIDTTIVNFELFVFIYYHQYHLDYKVVCSAKDPSNSEASESLECACVHISFMCIWRWSILFVLVCLFVCSFVLPLLISGEFGNVE